MYGLNKLYLLMEKQHNRGQEGAGLACVKLEADPGEEYMFRERCFRLRGHYRDISSTVQNQIQGLAPEQLHDAGYAKRALPFAGEVIWGICVTPLPESPGSHTCIRSSRRNNWRAKNLALCGKFQYDECGRNFRTYHCHRPASA